MLTTAAALLLAAASAVGQTCSTYRIRFAAESCLCIDNTDGNLSDGNHVQVWACAGNANQKWDFTPGKYPTNIKLHGTDFCLSGGPTPSDGAKLVIEPCDGSYSQVWSGMTSPWFCLFGTNYCIDLTDGDVDNGTKLQLWTRYIDNPNQQWAWDPQC